MAKECLELTIVRFGGGLLLSLCMVAVTELYGLWCNESRRKVAAQPDIHIELRERFASSRRERARKRKQGEENCQSNSNYNKTFRNYHATTSQLSVVHSSLALGWVKPEW